VPLRRTRQEISAFQPGEPQSGYYNDLSVEALRRADPTRLERLPTRAERRVANPITIAQVGLGAWQLARTDPAWLSVTRACASWLVENQDERGMLAFQFAMPHTFPLAAGWCSAMAQGEAASLLVRAARSFDDDTYLSAAQRAVRSLLDPADGLVADTEQGPVLQEYPTTPPAHVLNGWIFSLWGLYDVSLAAASSAATDAGTAFDAGIRALAARLHLYETWPGWSRYDLFPHRLTHVASPFYHDLHVAQLEAMAQLCPGLTVLSETAARWRPASANPGATAVAVGRKVVFRLLVPRRSG
jgi:heparosan-N-sulfate-glucuronate 5-epimerase